MRYLKNTQTGVIFFWTEILARKKHMVEVTPDELSVSEGREDPIPEPTPAPEPEVPAKTTVLNLEAMDKTQLDEYAEKELGLKLDRRKTKTAMIREIVRYQNGVVE